VPWNQNFILWMPILLACCYLACEETRLPFSRVFLPQAIVYGILCSR
jgi:hypothetical protein